MIKIIPLLLFEAQFEFFLKRYFNSNYYPTISEAFLLL